jgi:hypothetical protein
MLCENMFCFSASDVVAKFGLFTTFAHHIDLSYAGPENAHALMIFYDT